MFEVPGENVATWKRSRAQQYELPQGIDLACPNCSRKVTFSVEEWSNGPNSTAHARPRCPGCGGLATFIILNAANARTSLGGVSRLYVHPVPRVRPPSKDILALDEFSRGRLRSAYESMVNVYNEGEWAAAATMCRVVLEGVVHALLSTPARAGSPLDADGPASTKQAGDEADTGDGSEPRPKRKVKNLAGQLRKLPGRVDLGAPLLTLADTLREGGNLAAHFDLEREPDESSTTLMVELLEDLIDYLFVLPERIEELKEKVDSLPDRPADAAPEPTPSEKESEEPE